VLALGVGGCATVPAPRPAPAGDLAALTQYYQKVTRPQRRAVRKPVRDQRARALRELSGQAQLVLAQSMSWEQELGPALLAEAEQPELAGAVGQFRQSLSSLGRAAAGSDLPVVHREYRRTLKSWQQVRRLTDQQRH